MVAKSSNSRHPDLKALANRLRHHVLWMTHRAGSSHIGTNFSMIELLAVLYGSILRVAPDIPDWPNRDRFILSKGHGCAALYAVLAERGFFPLEWLESFYLNDSILAGHVTHKGVPGVEVSSGSLGHGLPIAAGMTLAAKRSGADYRVFTILSDGECDEGSIWEAALFAAHHHLDNLIAIIDYNKIQSLGRVEDILNLDSLAEKWQAFGWGVREIDGHDVNAIKKALTDVPLIAGKPTCIVAHTIKGKGVSFMEDSVLWHYRSPQGEEFEAALKELDDAS
jgi:transketolase